MKSALIIAPCLAIVALLSLVGSGTGFQLPSQITTHIVSARMCLAVLTTAALAAPAASMIAVMHPQLVLAEDDDDGDIALNYNGIYTDTKIIQRVIAHPHWKCHQNCNDETAR